ncbi:MAG: ATP synthase F1 subunit delta [Mariniblastus sp.]|nr:ATP synthase F1 subunit delta [Mariniblastus sp.]
MDQDVKHATVFDSDQHQLGKVYAQALLGFGQQKQAVDSLIGELDAVVDSVESTPQLKLALESPRISGAEKDRLVQKIFGGKVSQDLVNFLKIVGSKDRFDCLAAIRSAAHRLHDEMAGRVQATLTTAHQVDDSVRQKLQSKLSAVLGKQVGLSAKVDGTIIGGMVVRVGDTVYDGSVVNQLGRVRAKAVKRTTDAIRQSIENFMAD